MRNRALHRTAAALLLLPLLPPTSGESSPQTASWWLAEVNRQRLGASWHLAVKLRLSSDRGYRRELELDVRWASWDRRAATLAVITEPASLRGTAVLSWEQDDPPAVDRSWVFLNTRDPEVTEVAGAPRYEGLLGSDFSHEDQQRLIDLAAWRLEGPDECTCGAARCVRIAGRRRQPAVGPLVPDRVIWWIDRSRKEIARMELYARGRLLKIFEVTDWASADGFWIPRRQVMKSPELGSETTITLISSERVAAFPEADFRPETLASQARRMASEDPEGRFSTGHEALRVDDLCNFGI